MPTLLLLATVMLGHASNPDTTVRMNRGANVEIHAPGCAVVARVGTDDRLTVSGGTLSASGNSAEVGCGSILAQGRGAGTVTVTLPVGARVEVSTMQGDIRFTGATERLECSSVQGSITLLQGTGRTELVAVGGKVAVSDFSGVSLTVNAVSGGVRVAEGVFSGRLDVESVNGTVELLGIRSPIVNGQSVNGQITFAGTTAPAGSYRFESHNGGITLTLPRDVSARLRVSSFMGSFESALKAATTGRPDGGEFTVTYGKGEAQITAETFNGSIRVLARKP